MPKHLLAHVLVDILCNDSRYCSLSAAPVCTVLGNSNIFFLYPVFCSFTNSNYTRLVGGSDPSASVNRSTASINTSGIMRCTDCPRAYFSAMLYRPFHCRKKLFPYFRRPCLTPAPCASPFITFPVSEQTVGAQNVRYMGLERTLCICSA